MGRFENWKAPEIQHNVPTVYNWVVQYPDGFDLGKFTDIGAFTYINASEGVILDQYVQIGSHCSIYTVSTIDEKKGRVHLKENARIGSHSTIMPGVTVGANAVVGAHSFVNSDIPDNAVAYGVPAKVVRLNTEL